MNENAARFLRFVAALIGLVALGCVLTGLAAKPAQRGIPLATDWTHSHLVFSTPRSAEQEMRLQQDPRFEQQLYRRAQVQRLPDVQRHPENGEAGSPEIRFPVWRPHPNQGLWEQTLGAGATVGGANFPAKFSFNSAVANCGSAATPDFVVYSTGLTGSGTQASLVAYDNLYSGCTGTVPSVYWAYNTGGQIVTSPVFSLDGTKLAFVQTNAGVGSLVLLKWLPSSTESVASPGVPTSVAAASFAACAAPCMTSLILQDTSHVPTNDVNSSVYYDYGSDTAWVGDSRSWLHRFNPVFNGTLTEVGSPWPVQVNPANQAALSSPVYDSTSGNVFVGDLGGFFYRVSASAGTVTKSNQIDHGTGIVAGPIVDSVAGVAYVFASNDGVAPSSAVYQFASNFAAATSGTKTTVGASSAATKPLYEGALDSAYLNSNSTGNLYVCGHTGGRATLYQVPIAAGVMGTAVPGPVLVGATTGCSPVTDILNPNATGQSTEYIFAGVQNSGTPTACAAGGCVINFKDTPWKASAAYTAGQQIIDSHFQVQSVLTPGTSASSAPSWNTTVRGTTTDGTNGLTWVDLGVTTAAAPAVWVANHVYAVGNFIKDSNSNIEVVTFTTGNARSQGTVPTWSTTFGATLIDNHVTWTNAGPAPGALAAAGGTSGIIVDNTVTSGVSGSQIYFSTQSNQATCGTHTNVGCAVQASQSALK